VRLHAVLLGEPGRERVALGELRGEPQHVLPVAQPALGAQQQAQRGDVPRARALQALQRLARRAVVALADRHHGAREHRRRALPLVQRALHPRSRRSGSPSSCAERAATIAATPARRAALVGARGVLLGARIAALQPGLQGRGERLVRLLAAAPRAPVAHVRGQREHMLQQAHRDERRHEGEQRQHREEQQRHLQAPVGVGELHVALVEAPEHGDRRRRGEHRQQPEKRLHFGARSRRALKARTASRLPSIEGGATLTGEARSRSISASASRVACTRASK
jgi:hypothetical protein